MFKYLVLFISLLSFVYSTDNYCENENFQNTNYKIDTQAPSSNAEDLISYFNFHYWIPKNRWARAWLLYRAI